MRGRRISRLLALEVEEYRHACWHRENSPSVETAVQAEEFIERVGFAACLTDARQPGPSLYVAVCGRRDAIMPRNVQKDPESSHTWELKDEVMRRGRVYYGKGARGKTMFLAPRATLRSSSKPNSYCKSCPSVGNGTALSFSAAS
jgi:hypothetical protein